MTGACPTAGGAVAAAGGARAESAGHGGSGARIIAAMRCAVRHAVAALGLAACAAGEVADRPVGSARVGAPDADAVADLGLVPLGRDDASRPPPRDAATARPDAAQPGRDAAVGEEDAATAPDAGLDAAPPVDGAAVPDDPDMQPPECPPGHARQPDGECAPPPDAACAPRAETCNGADDDCDGRVDEAPVCGPWAERACRVTLGWADNRRGPAGPSDTWSACPAMPRQMGGDVRCTTTLGDGRFAHLDLDGNVDENDQLAVAFRCEDPDFAALAEWAETHCAVFLGWADDNRGPAEAEAWGACPAQVAGDGLLRCTSSGYDGVFRALSLDGDVDENDDLAVAFVCRDDADPDRARAFQSGAAVHLAWSPLNQGPPDGAERWTPECPGEDVVRIGRIALPRRCVQSGGDGRFHRLDFALDIDEDDDLGIALKRR